MDSKPALLGSDPVFERKVPIVRPWLPDYAALEEGIRSMLSSGMLTTGSYLRQFESDIAEHLDVKHAVAVSSCTTGLMLTYQSLHLTGEVIVPSFTFMATVSALVWAQLRPVFADVDVDTTNIDPSAVEALITPQTSAIVAVHNFGNPADIDALTTIAQRHNLKLIFDAAHGFGARYQGRPVGSQGDAQVYSLSPTKLLVAGEGGIVATNDDDLAQKLRIGREYGNRGDYNSIFAGFNARMSEFHALLGRQSLDQLEAAVTRRNDIVTQYRDELGSLPGIGFQTVRPGDRHSYKDFSMTIAPKAFGLSRDALALALAAENIDSRKYYDPPVHRHTAYARYAPIPGALPHTDRLATHSLSLPIWSHMDDATVAGICRAVQQSHVHTPAINIALKQKSAALVA